MEEQRRFNPALLSKPAKAPTLQQRSTCAGGRRLGPQRRPRATGHVDKRGVRRRQRPRRAEGTFLGSNIRGSSASVSAGQFGGPRVPSHATPPLPIMLPTKNHQRGEGRGPKTKGFQRKPPLTSLGITDKILHP